MSMAPGSKLAELVKIQHTGNRVVLPLVEEYLLSQWGRGDRDPTVVHVSEMAKKDWCERATYFRIKTAAWPEEKFSFNMSSIFDEGHQIHDKWQQWLAGTGKLWGDWECTACGEWIKDSTRDALSSRPKCVLGMNAHLWEYREVSLGHGLIHGHEDGAVEDRLVEFKSVGLGTLRKESPALLAKFYVTTTEGKKLYDLDALWKGLKQPLASHVRQTNLYLWLASQMGLPFDKASIVYEYKPNQQSREFTIPLSLDIVEPLVARVALIDSALRDQSAPPPCPYGGCRQCQAHDDPDPTIRTASGRTLTHRHAGLRNHPAARTVLGV